MPKKESNIYHRNDGRWEGRFHISGTKKYKSVYGKTYSEARKSFINYNVKIQFQKVNAAYHLMI